MPFLLLRRRVSVMATTSCLAVDSFLFVGQRKWHFPDVRVLISASAEVRRRLVVGHAAAVHACVVLPIQSPNSSPDSSPPNPTHRVTGQSSTAGHRVSAHSLDPNDLWCGHPDVHDDPLSGIVIFAVT